MRYRTTFRAAVLALGLGLIVAGCKGLLDVEPRSRIPTESLYQPSNAPLLFAGALGDFECAAGAYDAVSGIIGEELDDATLTADRYPTDQRVLQPSDRRYSVSDCANLGVYTPLQTARNTLENLLDALDGWTDADVPQRQTYIATVAAYSGYTHLLLAEGFCTMALSRLRPDGTREYGGEIQKDSVFAIAIDRFTRAIDMAEQLGNTDILNMALVGRARAYADIGRLPEAKADAARVPADYEHVITADGGSSRRENRLWSQNNATSTATSVGILYRTMNDPRVPVEPKLDANGNIRKNQNNIELWTQLKFTTADEGIPLATGDEARLIVIEANIDAGNFQAALDTLNVFRARGGQAPIATLDPAELKNELIEQRRRELFLEGQHLYDLIRFNIPLVPAPGAPYPGNGTYGSQLCMPLPDVERLNNPVLQ
ncbi:MAG TPA: RagB/SusD family nutrient uptake outer membrane protein [Gemmatimonadaceae bacterium]|nr:RagB/SusD family nutrient uptake outer membrane protein [Gemmatimonadaceae bacterium]